MYFDISTPECQATKKSIEKKIAQHAHCTLRYERTLTCTYEFIFVYSLSIHIYSFFPPNSTFINGSEIQIFNGTTSRASTTFNTTRTIRSVWTREKRIILYIPYSFIHSFIVKCERSCLYYFKLNSLGYGFTTNLNKIALIHMLTFHSCL